MNKNIIIILLIVVVVIYIIYKMITDINYLVKSKKIENAIKKDFVEEIKEVEAIKLVDNKSDNFKGILNKNQTKIIEDKNNSHWVEANNTYNTNIDILDKIVSEAETKKVLEKNYNGSVLLVDDSLVVRKYVGDLLKKYNFDVVIKNDGWEAMIYINSALLMPNIIITDIEMPNMDGIQLVNSIRKERKFKNIPILVISAHAASHLELMEEEKIQGFIKKPFIDQDLIQQTKYLIKSN